MEKLQAGGNSSPPQLRRGAKDCTFYVSWGEERTEPKKGEDGEERYQGGVIKRKMLGICIEDKGPSA